MSTQHRYGLILAGGSGTRLWPMSHSGQPKQLIPFVRNRSLLEVAFRRLDGLIDIENRLVCAAEADREAVLAAVPDLPTENFIGEPVGRDTLPAITYSTAIIRARDPEAVVAVLTADHIIEPEQSFRDILSLGFDIAEAKRQVLVTFGVRPDHPATGFGYLELGDRIEGHEARKVNRFREKPDLPTAERYVAAGPERYLWNSGTFVWRADTFLDCVAEYEPETRKRIDVIVARREELAGARSEFLDYLAKRYPEIGRISVDFAVMERASTSDRVEVVAVPLELSWLDIGSWTAFATTVDADDFGNRVVGRAVSLDTRDVMIVSDDEDHLVATLGVEDLVIVHTGKATLVCTKAYAQEIKRLHEEIATRFGREYL
jgi:mannose-1-phosphate guanylyltransferase